MNAVEFLKKQKRMCKSFDGKSCFDCRLFERCLATSDGLDFDEEEVVRIVEEWEEEHPILTNSNVFEDTFGISVKHLWDMNYPSMIKWQNTEFDKEKS